MFRLFLALVMALCCGRVLADDERRSKSVLDQIDRTLVKEPAYQSNPKYSLLALGPQAKVRVWMVEDGKRLYVDANANGDLTDDGPPILPSDFRSLGEDRWDFDYLLDAITPADGSRHTKFRLARWNYNDPTDKYGLSFTLDDKIPMYAGWFGTFWSSKPETAPVIHFGGSLTPRMLRSKEFRIGSGRQRFSMGFMNPGRGEGASSRLSIEAIPADVVPKVTVEWPTAGNGPAKRTSHELTKRCCYWEFYTFDFGVPDGIVEGTAKVMVEFPDSTFPLELTTDQMKVPVVKKATNSLD